MARPLLILILSLASCTLSLAADSGLSGTLLVANRTGGSVSLYDLETETEVTRLPIGERVPHELTASPDGRWAVTSEYGGGNNPGQHLIVIDITAAEILRRIDMGSNTRPHSIVLLNDSRHVVTTLERREAIALVDIIDGEIVNTFATGGSDSHMVRLSPDNRHAFVAARDSGTLSKIALDGSELTSVITTGARAEGISVSPDGERVWVANQGASTITAVDADAMKIVGVIGSIATNRVEFLPSGIAVIPGGTDDGAEGRHITYFNGSTLAEVGHINLPGSTAFGTGVRLLAANNALFLADSALNEISAVVPDLVGERTIIAINPDNVDGMAWSPLRVVSLVD
jgi:DNA-binding beta-propeller fold protein YncE